MIDIWRIKKDSEDGFRVVHGRDDNIDTMLLLAHETLDLIGVPDDDRMLMIRGQRIPDDYFPDDVHFILTHGHEERCVYVAIKGEE